MRFAAASSVRSSSPRCARSPRSARGSTRPDSRRGSSRSQAPPPGFRSPDLAPLEQRILRGEAGAVGGESPLPVEVELLAARDPSHEVEIWARAIDRWIRSDEQPVRPGEIAIIVRDLETYRPIVEETFARFHIPVFVDRHWDISSRPLVRTILDALEVLAPGWQREAVIAFLRSPLLGARGGEIDILENLSLEAGFDFGIGSASPGNRCAGRRARASCAARKAARRGASERAVGGGSGGRPELESDDEGEPTDPADDAIERASRTSISNRIRAAHLEPLEGSWRGSLRRPHRRAGGAGVPARVDPRHAGTSRRRTSRSRREIEAVDHVLEQIADEIAERSRSAGGFRPPAGRGARLAAARPDADAARHGDPGRGAAITSGRGPPRDRRAASRPATSRAPSPPSASSTSGSGPHSRARARSRPPRSAPAGGGGLFPLHRPHPRLGTARPHPADDRPRGRLARSVSLPRGDPRRALPGLDGVASRRSRRIRRTFAKRRPSRSSPRASAPTSPRGSIGASRDVAASRNRRIAAADDRRILTVYNQLVVPPAIGADEAARFLDETRRLWGYDNRATLPAPILRLAIRELGGSRRSVGRLESFARCPYQHFARHMLRLRPRPEAEVTPLENGLLTHRALEVLLQEGPPPTDARRSSAGSQGSSMRSRTSRICAPSASTPGGRLRWRRRAGSSAVSFEIEARRLAASDFPAGLIRAGVRDERNRRALRIPLADGAELRLRGRIDRIDVAGKGPSGSARHRLQVGIDHRQGPARRRREGIRPPARRLPARRRGDLRHAPLRRALRARPAAPRARRHPTTRRTRSTSSSSASFPTEDWDARRRGPEADPRIAISAFKTHDELRDLLDDARGTLALYARALLAGGSTSPRPG